MNLPIVCVMAASRLELHPGLLLVCELDELRILWMEVNAAVRDGDD